MLYRKTSKIFSLFILAVLVISACSPTEDLAGDADVIAPAVVGSETYESGQTLYMTHCAACHGANGEGQFPDAPLEPDSTGRYGAPPHNSAGHTWHHDDDLLIQIIREGGMGDPQNFYDMPAFESTLSAEEMEPVLAYIKTFWTRDEQANQAAATRLIRQQNAEASN